MPNRVAYHQYYSTWYRNDAATIASTGRFYADVLAPYLPRDQRARILDVGAGIGLLLRKLKEMGYQCATGVEVNAAQIAGAGEFAADIVLTDNTARWLQERDSEYDVILCLDVLEHVPKALQTDLVRAMVGALRPGGRLVCTVPNANSAIASRWRYNDYTHEVSFTEHSLQFVLAAGGLSQIQVAGSPVFQFSSGGYSALKRGISAGLRLGSRVARRLEFMGELGLDEALRIPLDVNLLGTGIRG